MIQVKNSFPIFAGLLAVCLGSCGPLVKLGEDGPAPLRFGLAFVGAEVALQSVPLSLRIEEIDAPQEFNVDRMVVRVGTQEIQYLKDMRWSDKPARLLRQLIAEHIKAQNPDALILLPTQLEPIPQFRLSGRIAAFQVNRDSNTAKVKIEMLMISAKTKSTVSKTFEAQVDANVASSSDMAAALNRASNKVCSDIAAWVGTTTR
jgi:cholesterol transport system auxiliary component